MYSLKTQSTAVMVNLTSPNTKPQVAASPTTSHGAFQARPSLLKRKISQPTAPLRAVNMFTPEGKQDAPTTTLVSKEEYSLLADLQNRLEDLWFDFAAARKRIASLQGEKEELQTQLRNTTVALKQERHNRRRAEEKAAHLAARLESAQCVGVPVRDQALFRGL